MKTQMHILVSCMRGLELQDTQFEALKVFLLTEDVGF